MAWKHVTLSEALISLKLVETILTYRQRWMSWRRDERIEEIEKKLADLADEVRRLAELRQLKH